MDIGHRERIKRDQIVFLVMLSWLILDFEMIWMEATVKLITYCENMWQLAPMNSEKNGFMESMVSDQNINNLLPLYIGPEKRNSKHSQKIISVMNICYQSSKC